MRTNKSLRIGRWSFTVYPRQSAMHGAWDIGTPWGYLCVRFPMWSFGAWWPPYLYFSPDATPNRKRWGWFPWRTH